MQSSVCEDSLGDGQSTVSNEESEEELWSVSKKRRYNITDMESGAEFSSMVSLLMQV